MPADARGFERVDDALELLAGGAPAGDAIEVRRSVGRHLPGSFLTDAQGRHVPCAVLVFLDDLAPLAGDLASGSCVERPASEGQAVFFADLSAEAYARLHGPDGACRGCVLVGEDDDPAARRGLFEYAHSDTENWIAGPYTLERRPREPLSADSLPGDLRAACAKFPGRFAETERLQPVEHWRCESWGAAFLASDRRSVGPVPGREDDYAAEADDLRGLAEDQGLVIQAPLPTHAPPGSAGGPEARPGARKRPWWKLW
jgi:hypothetical protein